MRRLGWLAAAVAGPALVGYAGICAYVALTLTRPLAARSATRLSNSAWRMNRSNFRAASIGSHCAVGFWPRRSALRRGYGGHIEGHERGPAAYDARLRGFLDRTAGE